MLKVTTLGLTSQSLVKDWKSIGAAVANFLNRKDLDEQEQVSMFIYRSTCIWCC
jgi:hypothetical protein